MTWSVITTMIAFLSMSTVEDCQELEEKESNRFTAQLNCPDGTYQALGAICELNLQYDT